MDFQEALQRASEQSSVLRQRKNLLYTFGATRLPYIVLSEAPDGADGVHVRQGEVTAEPPRIAVPDQQAMLEGFDFGDLPQGAVPVMLARRVQLPPLKYHNAEGARRVEAGPMEAAIDRTMNRLETDNDSRTAVIRAPLDVWALSVLLYAGSQIVRSAPSNLAEHFERMRLRGQ